MFFQKGGGFDLGFNRSQRKTRKLYESPSSNAGLTAPDYDQSSQGAFLPAGLEAVAGAGVEATAAGAVGAAAGADAAFGAAGAAPAAALKPLIRF